MYLKADAQIEITRHYSEGLVPGQTRVTETARWVTGEVAAISLFAAAARDRSGLQKAKVGDLVEFAGLRCRVILVRPEWSDSIYVVRDKWLFSWLYVGWYWLKRCLQSVNRLLWRTVWAWGMMDYNAADMICWRNQFRPWKWLRKKRSGG